MYNVIRVEKNKDYTVISNTHLMDTGLSLKAKGIMTILLALPNDTWELSVEGLSKLSKDQRDSVSTALKELEAKHYLIRTQKFDDRNKFSGYEYTLYEKPIVKSTEQEFPFTEFPFTENPQQLNTNILNINNTSNTSKNKRNILDINKAYMLIDNQISMKDVADMMREWFCYKRDRNETYTERGFKALLTEVQNNVNKYGEKNVCDCIAYTMSHEWKGIVWDAMQQVIAKNKPKKYNNPFLNLDLGGEG